MSNGQVFFGTGIFPYSRLQILSNMKKDYRTITKEKPHFALKCGKKSNYIIQIVILN